MKYIIMCGGKYEGWDKPKPLYPVNGEPIVCRTVRLLREAGVDNIAISSTEEGLYNVGVPVVYHMNRYGHGGRWLEAFYPIHEPVCYLYGDVIYSPEAIKKIVETDTDSIEFFASCPPYGDGYIKHWEEPMAYKVRNTELFWHCIEVTKHYGDLGKFHREPVSWELWQVIKGTPLDKVLYNYTVINDYSCDVDSLEDIEKIGEYIRCNCQ